MMKRITLCCLIIPMMLFAASCNRDGENLMGTDQYTDYSFQGIEPVKVDKAPNGYISLSDVIALHGSLFTIGFFESQIYVLDLDGKNIKQTSISDNSFSVQYKNDLYISGIAIQDILALADQTADARNRIYHFGEPFEIYDGQQKVVTVVVNAVSYVRADENLGIKDDMWACIVDIDIQKNDEEINIYNDYFERAEMKGGQVYNDTLGGSPDQMIFVLPSEEKAHCLFIKSPFYDEQIRKVYIADN